MGTNFIPTESSCKHILNSLGQLQQLGQIGACPRCGFRPMNPKLMLNSLSRYADVYICEACGMEEAVLAASQEEPIPFPKWSLFQKHEQDAPVRDTFVNAVPDVREAKITKQLYALGLALDRECQENDCRLYKNTFNMARELDGALDIVGGYAATVLKFRLHERIRELREMWTENCAILAYRAQHFEALNQ